MDIFFKTHLNTMGVHWISKYFQIKRKRAHSYDHITLIQTVADPREREWDGRMSMRSISSGAFQMLLRSASAQPLNRNWITGSWFWRLDYLKALLCDRSARAFSDDFLQTTMCLNGSHKFARKKKQYIQAKLQFLRCLFQKRIQIAIGRQCNALRYANATKADREQTTWRFVHLLRYADQTRMYVQSKKRRTPLFWSCVRYVQPVNAERLQEPSRVLCELRRAKSITTLLAKDERFKK